MFDNEPEATPAEGEAKEGGDATTDAPADAPAADAPAA